MLTSRRYHPHKLLLHYNYMQPHFASYNVSLEVRTGPSLSLLRLLLLLLSADFYNLQLGLASLDVCTTRRQYGFPLRLVDTCNHLTYRICAILNNNMNTEWF